MGEKQMNKREELSELIKKFNKNSIDTMIQICNMLKINEVQCINLDKQGGKVSYEINSEALKQYTNDKYIDYFFARFKSEGDKEYIISLFYKDFDGNTGNIHVLPGIVQLWKIIDSNFIGEDLYYSFPNSKATSCYTETVEWSSGKRSDYKKEYWKPLISYSVAGMKSCQLFEEDDLKDIINNAYVTSKKCYIDLRNTMRECVNAELEQQNVKINYVNGTGKNLIFTWSKEYFENCSKYYFLCAYKHIKTDYGWFIRYDGNSTLYQVKYKYNLKKGGYNSGPNKLDGNKFFINYTYYKGDVKKLTMLESI